MPEFALIFAARNWSAVAGVLKEEMKTACHLGKNGTPEKSPEAEKGGRVS
ncbi:hypothetical protein [Ottowia massiliensis]|nr:hypothetical protein [Ottowia massiliensis]